MVDTSKMDLKGKGKYIIGLILLTVLTSSVYLVLIDEGVKIDIQETRTFFYVDVDGDWVNSGIEYVNLFDGTAKMRASSRNLETYVNATHVVVERSAIYKQNISIIEHYIFESNNGLIEKFPVAHNIRVFNGVGKILQYEITKLKYTGETVHDITSPQSFGWDMKADWSPGNYYSRIYKYKNKDEAKLTIKYRPDTDDFTIQARMFDPVTVLDSSILSPINNTKYYINSIDLNWSVNENITNAYFILDNETANTSIYTAEQNSECYQEFADGNINGCGFDTGSYSADVHWYTPANIYDGDWNTFTSPQHAEASLNITYYKATNAIGATWKTQEDTNGLQYLTIPDDCFDFNEDYIKLQIYATNTFTANWSCMNDTDVWKTIGYDTGSNRPAEEAITWDISIPESKYNVTLSDLSDGLHNITIYTNSTVDGSESDLTTHNFSVYNESQYVYVYSPFNNGTYGTTVVIKWNTTIPEVEIDECLINDITTLTYGEDDVMSGLPAAFYDYMYINCTDIYGRNALTYFNFTVTVAADTDAPVVVANELVSEYIYYNNRSLVFTFNISDRNPNTIAQCYSYLMAWSNVSDSYYPTQDNFVSNCTSSMAIVPDGYYDRLYQTTDLLIEGKNQILIWVFDETGNDASYTFNFSVDSIAPVINVTTPTNNSYITNTTANINYTVTDDANVTCQYITEEIASNITLVDCANFSINISEAAFVLGLNNITIFVNDSPGNLGSSNLVFHVNNVTPTVNVTSPVATSTYNYTNVSFNWNASRDLASLYYKINSGSTIDTELSNVTLSLPEGAINLTLFATDLYGMTYNETILFTIDTTAPTISAFDPSPEDLITTDPFMLEFFIDDAAGVCRWSHDAESYTDMPNDCPNETTSTACTQETPTSTADCSSCSSCTTGGSAAIIDGSWTGGNPTYVYDGDWSTYGSIVDAGMKYIGVTYEKPAGVTSADWKVKDIGGNTTVSVSSQCWDYDADYLYFRLGSRQQAPSEANWDCQYGASSWETLHDISDAGAGTHGKLYEEQILWDVELGCSIDTLVDGFNDVYLSCKDIYNNGADEYTKLTYSVDITPPEINLIVPANNSIYHYVAEVPFEYTYNESLISCNYSLDGAAYLNINFSTIYQEVADSTSRVDVNKTEGYYEMEYDVPSAYDITQAFWQVKMLGTPITTINYTLPYSCLDNDDDEVTLRTYFSGENATTYLKCYNGSSWLEVGSKYLYINGWSYYFIPYNYHNDSLWNDNSDIYRNNYWVQPGTGSSGSLAEEAMWWKYPNLSTISVSAGSHNLTLNCSDINNRTGASNYAYFSVNNSIVNVTILSPLNDSVHSTDEVDLNWTVNETINWAGFKFNNGTMNTSIYDGGASNTSLNISTLKNGQHTIQVFTNTSTDHNGSSDITYFNTSGGPTIATSSVVSSDGYYANSEYYGYCNATDTNTANIYYKYTWYIEKAVYSSGTTTRTYPQGVLSNVANLSAFTVEKGNYLNFECIGFDGVKESEALKSTLKTVLDSNPTVTDVYIDPNPIGPYEDIDLWCEGRDYDGERFMFDYELKNGTNTLTSGAYRVTSALINYSAAKKVKTYNSALGGGVNLTFICSITDYGDTSTMVKYFVTNSTPVVTSTINPSIAYTKDPLTLICNATDAENDNVTYTWSIYKNDILYTSGISNSTKIGVVVATYSAETFDVYDEIKLSCTGTDTVSTSEIINTTRTIQSPIIMQNVRVTPNPIIEIVNLTGYCQASHVEDDPIAYYYKWSYGSDVLKTGNYGEPSLTYSASGVEVTADIIDKSYLNGNSQLTLSCRGYDGTDYSDWMNYTTNVIPGLYLMFETFGRSVIAETGSEINITAGHTDGITEVCLDINHSDYGVDYNCSTSEINVYADVSKNVVNTSSVDETDFLLVYDVNGGDKSFSITSSSYDSPYNLTFNVTPLAYDTNYPEDITVSIGDVVTNILGSFRTGLTQLIEFDNGEETTKISFVASGLKKYYFSMPKLANVSAAKLNLSGNNNTNIDLGNGSDGNLTFTTAVKSYGNLVLNTDYQVVGNTLYLKLNRKYQFDNFSLGAGTTISTFSANGAALYILVNGTASVKGTINLKGQVNPGVTGNSFTVDGITITAPGAALGGNGGRIGDAGTSTSSFGGGGQGATAYYYEPPDDICLSRQPSGNDHDAVGGLGGAGSSVFGIPGVAISCSERNSAGVCITDGATGTGSAGGSGGAYAWLGYYRSGSSCYGVYNVFAEALSGTGGSSYGAAGTSGTADADNFDTPYAGVWSAYAGGGGGAGGIAGIPGVHLYFKAKDLDATGLSIDLSGTNAGNGGNGGKTRDYDGVYWGPGGYGGGGGGGGNSGSLYLYYTALTGTLIKSLNGGTAGTGGKQYSSFTNAWTSNSNNGAPGTSGSYNPISYLSLDNPYMKVGELNGSYDWNYTGTFNISEITSDFNESLMYALNNCTANEYGKCRIPIYFSSESLGILEVMNISINYTYDPNPIEINASDILDYLEENCDGVCTFPITISSTNKGKLNISNILYTSYGLTKSFTAIAHPGTGNYTPNITRTVSYILSKYNYSLPGNLDYIDFYPPSSTSDNVQPFGQTNSQSILTVNNIGEDGLNWYIYLNNSESCVDLSASSSNTKADGGVLTTTWTNISNISNDGSIGVWMWADYDCSYSNWRLYNPDFYFKACCDTCDICSDSLD